MFNIYNTKVYGYLHKRLTIQFSSAPTLLGADWSVCDQSEVHPTSSNGGTIQTNGGLTLPNQCFCL